MAKQADIVCNIRDSAEQARRDGEHHTADLYISWADEIDRLRAALNAGTDAAQTLLSLPADECNVPFDPVNAAEIKGRRKAARHILDILNQQQTVGDLPTRDDYPR